MKSPFPGMDPFLEGHWGDVHTSLIVYICDQINDVLPSDLRARIEENVFRTNGYLYPNTRFSEEDRRLIGTPAASSATVPVAKPWIISLLNEIPTQRHIEIVTPNGGGRVVTAIELLSLTNKMGGPARRAYRKKQREYLEAGVNLVEIDLIRTGSFIVAVPEQLIPIWLRAPYVICIRRVTNPEEAEIISIPLRQPLPNVSIPLRPTDADIVVQLQPLLDKCYRRGRYATIDYSQRLIPPLDKDDAQWSEELLEKHRLARNGSTPAT
jgi:hypothetical protein